MQITLSSPAGTYQTRLLHPPDLAALQALFERCADYFTIATGRPPGPDEAQRAYVAGPPSRSVEDKRVVGVFEEGGTLVGVLDALTGFPDDGTWTMAMLLLDPAHRGNGLGGAVLAAWEDWAERAGGRAFRTAVVAHHEPGLRFLEARGYRSNATVENYDAGGSRPTVVFLEKRPG